MVGVGELGVAGCELGVDVDEIVVSVGAGAFEEQAINKNRANVNVKMGRMAGSPFVVWGIIPSGLRNAEYSVMCY
jgi:hypothetical protein